MLITSLCPPIFVITFLIILSCSLILVDNVNKEVSSLVNAFVSLPFAAGLVYMVLTLKIVVQLAKAAGLTKSMLSCLSPSTGGFVDG